MTMDTTLLSCIAIAHYAQARHTTHNIHPSRDARKARFGHACKRPCTPTDRVDSVLLADVIGATEFTDPQKIGFVVYSYTKKNKKVTRTHTQKDGNTTNVHLVILLIAVDVITTVIVAVVVIVFVLPCTIIPSVH